MHCMHFFGAVTCSFLTHRYWENLFIFGILPESIAQQQQMKFILFSCFALNLTSNRAHLTADPVLNM